MGKTSGSSNKSKEAREARKVEQRRLADLMKLVSGANSKKAQDLEKICGELLQYKIDQYETEVSITRVTELDPEVLKWAIDLTERNMKTLYEQCAWGWSLRKKSEEMSEDEAWYAVVRSGTEPVAFSHFRFDMDHGDAVVYCYEVQVEEAWRGRGVGARLLAVLERLAREARMCCVRLTALTHNPRAAAFFRNAGYTLDETSPDASEAAHYEILSKYVERDGKRLERGTPADKLVGELQACSVAS